MDCETSNYCKTKSSEMKSISLAYREIRDTYFLSDNNIDLENINILDLSHNKIKNLTFLSAFINLNTLILDQNYSLIPKTLPFMPNLKILWLNNCHIVNNQEWLRAIQLRCPNLENLSMMCNPVGATVLNGVSEEDEIEYRKEILKILPKLNYLDGSLTKQEKENLIKSTYNNADKLKQLISKILKRKWKNVNKN